MAASWGHFSPGSRFIDEETDHKVTGSVIRKAGLPIRVVSPQSLCPYPWPFHTSPGPGRSTGKGRREVRCSEASWGARVEERIWKLDWGRIKKLTLRYLDVVYEQGGATKGLWIRQYYKSHASGRLTRYNRLERRDRKRPFGSPLLN